MVNIPYTSNNDINYKSIEYKYKTCARLHCNNIPIHYLKVVLINKFGWFCPSCKRELEEDNLLESDLAVDTKIGIDCLKVHTDVKKNDYSIALFKDGFPSDNNNTIDTIRLFIDSTSSPFHEQRNSKCNELFEILLTMLSAACSRKM